MNTEHAISAFDSLAQETRLAAFRLLMEYGTTGAAAGLLCEKLDVPANTLSFHLAHMLRAGLVTSERKGRSIVYRVDTSFFTGLMRFMVENCCSADVARMREDTPNNCSIIEMMNCC